MRVTTGGARGIRWLSVNALRGLTRQHGHGVCMTWTTARPQRARRTWTRDLILMPVGPIRRDACGVETTLIAPWPIARITVAPAVPRRALLGHRPHTLRPCRLSVAALQQMRRALLLPGTCPSARPSARLSPIPRLPMLPSAAPRPL